MFCDSSPHLVPSSASPAIHSRAETSCSIKRKKSPTSAMRSFQIMAAKGFSMSRWSSTKSAVPDFREYSAFSGRVRSLWERGGRFPRGHRRSIFKTHCVVRYGQGTGTPQGWCQAGSYDRMSHILCQAWCAGWGEGGQRLL